MAFSHSQSESFGLEFQYRSRFSKTRDAIFHNSFKRCLTYYIEMLNVVSLLIPPTSTLLTKGKVSSLMKTKSKRQRKFKETWVSKKWNKSGATLDERWRRRRNKDKKEIDDDRRSGIATRKVKTAKPLKMPLNLGIFLSFFISLVYTLPADFHFPADIQYFPRNGRYVPIFGADQLP